MIARRRTQLLSVLLDALLVVLALRIAFLSRFDGVVPPVEMAIFFRMIPMLLPVFLLTFLFSGLYRVIWGVAGAGEYLRFIRAFFIGLLILVAALFYARILGYSRLVLLIFAAVAFALLVLWRAMAGVITRALWRKGYLLRDAVVIGEEDEERVRTVREVFSSPARGVRIKEILPPTDPRVDLIRDPQGEMPEYVFLAASEERPAEVMDLLERLAGRPGLQVRMVPGILTLLANRAPMTELAGLLLLDVGLTRSSEYYLPVKRLLDVTGAVLGLILFSPLLLFAAGGILLSDGSPILYLQKRIGQNGIPFRIYKFRTMRLGADCEAALTSENDARVLPFGRFLRRWSLDELPQLMNILKGEMSFVGPRPEIPEVVEGYNAWQRRALEAPPGLSGLVQVSGRDNLSLEEKSRVDLYYVRHRTFALDVSILIKTIGAVLSGEGQR